MILAPWKLKGAERSVFPTEDKTLSAVLSFCNLDEQKKRWSDWQRALYVLYSEQAGCNSPPSVSDKRLVIPTSQPALAGHGLSDTCRWVLGADTRAPVL